MKTSKYATTKVCMENYLHIVERLARLRAWYDDDGEEWLVKYERYLSQRFEDYLRHELTLDFLCSELDREYNIISYHIFVFHGGKNTEFVERRTAA